MTAQQFDAEGDGPQRAVAVGVIAHATATEITRVGKPWPVSPDGRYVCLLLDAAASVDRPPYRIVDLWGGGRPIHDRPFPAGYGAGRAQFSPDGRQMAWSCDGVYVLDLQSRRIDRLAGTRAGPVAFSPDGRSMAGKWGAPIHVWPTPSR